MNAQLAIRCFLLCLLGTTLAPAASRPFLLASPDHPAVWYNRAGDKVQQRLDWNPQRRELAARVAYSEVEFVPLRDQYYYDNFRLVFPGVRLNDATSRLYFVDHHGRRTEFGRVTEGHIVQLDPGVDFEIFRGNDTVHAVIRSGLGSPAPRNEH